MMPETVQDIRTDRIEPELPKGWVWTKLGEISEDIETVQPRDEPDKEFLYLAWIMRDKR
jgi:hypothetical protein